MYISLEIFLHLNTTFQCSLRAQTRSDHVRLQNLPSNANHAVTRSTCFPCVTSAWSHSRQLLVTIGNFWPLSSRVRLQAGEDVAHWGEDDEEDEGGGEEGVAQHVHRQEELANHAAGGVPG